MTPDYVALVKRMLAAVESNDIEGYLGFFAPDAEYVIGNSGPVTGTDAIRAAAANSVQNVQSVTHEVHNMFAPGDGVVIFDSDVTYARKDGKTIRIPSLAIVYFRGDRVQRYQAYIDLSPVSAPS